MNEELVKEFDELIEDLPVDWLGTGSSQRHANKEAAAWESRAEAFREKLRKQQDGQIG